MDGIAYFARAVSYDGKIFMKWTPGQRRWGAEQGGLPGSQLHRAGMGRYDPWQGTTWHGDTWHGDTWHGRVALGRVALGRVALGRVALGRVALGMVALGMVALGIVSLHSLVCR